MAPPLSKAEAQRAARIMLGQEPDDVSAANSQQFMTYMDGAGPVPQVAGAQASTDPDLEREMNDIWDKYGRPGPGGGEPTPQPAPQPVPSNSLNAPGTTTERITRDGVTVEITRDANGTQIGRRYIDASGEVTDHVPVSGDKPMVTPVNAPAGPPPAPSVAETSAPVAETPAQPSAPPSTALPRGWSKNTVTNPDGSTAEVVKDYYGRQVRVTQLTPPTAKAESAPPPVDGSAPAPSRAAAAYADHKSGKQPAQPRERIPIAVGSTGGGRAGPGPLEIEQYTVRGGVTGASGETITTTEDSTSTDAVAAAAEDGISRHRVTADGRVLVDKATLERVAPDMLAVLGQPDKDGNYAVPRSALKERYGDAALAEASEAAKPGEPITLNTSRGKFILTPQQNADGEPGYGVKRETTRTLTAEQSFRASQERQRLAMEQRSRDAEQLERHEADRLAKQAAFAADSARRAEEMELRRQAEIQQRLADIDAARRQVNAAKDIDPGRWAKNASTMTKIASVIGAGLMGYAGKGEVMLKVIQNQIDTDIAAQRDSYERKRNNLADAQSAYGLARQAFADEASAVAATRVQAYTALLAELDSAKHSAGAGTRTQERIIELEQGLQQQRVNEIAYLQALQGEVTRSGVQLKQGSAPAQAARTGSGSGGRSGREDVTAAAQHIRGRDTARVQKEVRKALEDSGLKPGSPEFKEAFDNWYKTGDLSRPESSLSDDPLYIDSLKVTAKDEKSAEVLRSLAAAQDGVNDNVAALITLINQPGPINTDKTRVGEIQAKIGDLMMSYKRMEELGALDKGLIEFFDKIVGDPTAITNSLDRIKAQLRQLQASVANKVKANIKHRTKQN